MERNIFKVKQLNFLYLSKGFYEPLQNRGKSTQVFNQGDVQARERT